MLSEELYAFNINFSPLMREMLNSIVNDVALVAAAASVSREQLERVGPVIAPDPPYTKLNAPAARRSPTGSFDRGWIPPSVGVPAAAAHAASQISGFPFVPLRHDFDVRFARYAECFVSQQPHCDAKLLKQGPDAGPHASSRSPAWAKKELGIATFGSTP